MPTNLPNVLTYSRIVAVPVVVGVMFIEAPLGNWLALAIFTLAGITDFFDGYLARAWSQQSSMGRFLDPVADKLLVVAVILLLIAFDRIDGFWTVLAAIVIVCREILVSGLREFLAEIRVGMPVSALAKWKTTVQILALGFLLAGEAGDALLPSTTIGTWGLWIAAALTLYTGYDYLRAGLDHMRHEDDGGGGESGSP